MTARHYGIGSPGVPWGSVERQAWLALQRVRRSYLDEVVARLEAVPSPLQKVAYGSLRYHNGTYPLWALVSRNWDVAKPGVLITGGVHGYETSGVQGAIRFAVEHASDYDDHFNIAIAPCISPWGYETINRWNPKAIDPNRSFYAQSPAQESASLIDWVSSLSGTFAAHFDLHETTDTDDTEFRPALAARDGVTFSDWGIPDGFYAVGDSAQPQHDFQRAVIAAVEKVTHIAPADSAGKIIGEPVTQHGVINYDVRPLGLCAGITDAPYRTTTEVYPNSPRTDAETCIEAQVAAVRGGLDYLMALASPSAA